MNVNERFEHLMMPGIRNRSRGGRSRPGGRGRGHSIGFIPSRKPIMKTPRRSIMGPPTKMPPRSKKSSTTSSSSLNTPKTIWNLPDQLNSSSTINTSTDTDSVIYPESNYVIAICEGRALATCEVGIAVIDMQNPIVILCQFSDVFSYMKTVTKLNMFLPTHILVPSTFLLKPNRLIEKIKERFKECTLTPVPRNTFNKQMGLNYVRTICAPTYCPVILTLHQRYYALSAAGALLNYAEENLHTRLAQQSVKVMYEESENCTVIDLATADHLELVVSANPVAKSRYACLFGVLNHCRTRIGSRTLRASILQPPCDIAEIDSRLKCVTELINNNALLVNVQESLSKLANIDRLLSFGFVMPTQANLCTERQLNYLLLLNSILSNVDPLEEILAAAYEPFFKDLQKTLQNEKFAFVRDLIREIIHSDAKPARGQVGNLQRCFAIKDGINTMLDVLRKTYSEKIEDMRGYVEQLGELYKLPLKLSHSHKKGFHINYPLTYHQRNSMQITDIPPEFIHIEKMHTCFTMRTFDLVNLSTRVDEILQEVMGMSNIIVFKTLCEVRKEIGIFYKLCDEVAHLDLLQSLAQASLVTNYVQPKFASYMELTDARHPLLDFLCSKEPVPNNVFASEDYNFHVITGPNMSGKSIYLRQIVLLQIMAQVGCYVPATKATFRVADKIFAKIYLEDNMELGASAFVLEMKEIQYFFNTMTENSLIILDELARSTSCEQGTAIAWSICVKFLNSKAFTFLTTHFPNLTRLDEVYFCVKNWQLETKEETDDNDTVKMKFTHTLIPGVTTIKNYGLKICQGFLPQAVIDLAKPLQPLVELQVPSAVNRELCGEWRGQKLKYDLEAEMRLLASKGRLTDEIVNTMVGEYKQSLLNLGKMREEDKISVSTFECGHSKELDEKEFAETVMTGAISDEDVAPKSSTSDEIRDGHEIFESTSKSDSIPAEENIPKCVQNSYENRNVQVTESVNEQLNSVRSSVSVPLFNSSSSSVPPGSFMQKSFLQTPANSQSNNLQTSAKFSACTGNNSSQQLVDAERRVFENISTQLQYFPGERENATASNFEGLNPVYEKQVNASDITFDVTFKDNNSTEGLSNFPPIFTSQQMSQDVAPRNDDYFGFSQYTQQSFDSNPVYDNISEISYQPAPIWNTIPQKCFPQPISNTENNFGFFQQPQSSNYFSNLGNDFFRNRSTTAQPGNQSLMLIQNYKDSQEDMFKLQPPTSYQNSLCSVSSWNVNSRYYNSPINSFEVNSGDKNSVNIGTKHFQFQQQENVNQAEMDRPFNYNPHEKVASSDFEFFKPIFGVKQQNNLNLNTERQIRHAIEANTVRTSTMTRPTESTGMNSSVINWNRSSVAKENSRLSQETMISTDSKQFYKNVHSKAGTTSTPLRISFENVIQTPKNIKQSESTEEKSQRNSVNGENSKTSANLSSNSDRILSDYHENIARIPAQSSQSSKLNTVIKTATDFSRNHNSSWNSTLLNPSQLSHSEMESVKTLLEEYSEYLEDDDDFDAVEDSATSEITSVAKNNTSFGAQVEEDLKKDESPGENLREFDMTNSGRTQTTVWKNINSSISSDIQHESTKYFSEEQPNIAEKSNNKEIDVEKCELKSTIRERENTDSIQLKNTEFFAEDALKSVCEEPKATEKLKNQEDSGDNNSDVSSNLNDYYYRSQEFTAEDMLSFYTQTDKEDNKENTCVKEEASITYSPEIMNTAEENQDICIIISSDSSVNEHENSQIVENFQCSSNQICENDNFFQKNIQCSIEKENEVKKTAPIAVCEEFVTEISDESSYEQEDNISKCNLIEEVEEPENFVSNFNTSSVNEQTEIHCIEKEEIVACVEKDLNCSIIEKTPENSFINSPKETIEYFAESAVKNQEGNQENFEKSVAVQKSERLVRQRLDDLNMIVEEIRAINQRTLPPNYLEIMDRNDRILGKESFNVIPKTPSHNQSEGATDENESTKSSSQDCFKVKNQQRTSSVGSFSDVIPDTPIESLKSLNNVQEIKEKLSGSEAKTKISNTTHSSSYSIKEIFQKSSSFMDVEEIEEKSSASKDEEQISLRASANFHNSPMYSTKEIVHAASSSSCNGTSGQEFTEIISKICEPEDNNYAKASNTSKPGRKRTLTHPTLFAPKKVTKKQYELEKNENFLNSLQKYGDDPDKFIASVSHYPSYKTFKQMEPLIQFDRCLDGSLKATDIRPKKQPKKRTKFDLVIPEDMRGKSMMSPSLLADANVDKFEECLKNLKENRKNKERALRKTLGMSVKKNINSPAISSSFYDTSSSNKTVVTPEPPKPEAKAFALINYSQELERLSLEEAALQAGSSTSGDGEKNLQQLSAYLLEHARKVGEGTVMDHMKVEARRKTLGMRGKVSGEVSSGGKSICKGKASKGKYGKNTMKKGAKENRPSTAEKHCPLPEMKSVENVYVQNWGSVAFKNELMVSGRSTEKSKELSAVPEKVFSERSQDVQLSFLTSSNEDSKHMKKESSDVNISQILKKYLN